MASYDLIAEKLEQAKREHMATLNREMFSDHAIDALRYGPMSSHINRIPRWWRVRRYLSTLWKALRGDELEPPNEELY